ncbi:hypothetical protein MNEG_5307 [Monoraphidium neglectum]|uniref:ABC transmembrane type-1 domain-containing protein n=1 Tax=Monoraphidium neglectum TaxID=145388 RepID=A0A0D2MQG3_9CHLO|nr:hypothetical protein MNEG_5307 [Monoraphidium neglectum]KIZ02657.1 hypothetical protein MNEG_5307 [Monoraphidium neglectum]|eukprot:XP_013901676.1 hypothetical protein MNEG_5307 [Monoraphidium neglectum]
MWAWLIGTGQPGLGGAGIWSRICWTWVNPLINKGWAETLEEDDARFLVPARDEVEPLAARFESKYEQILKARTARRARGVTRAPLVNATTEALLRIFWLEFIWHSFWALVETAARVLSPLALREFLRWLQRDAADGAAEADWRGWLLALAVLAGGGSLTLIHHVFFWVGMRLGYIMRQQVVSAIHAKVLRLNSASVAHASTGT